MSYLNKGDRIITTTPDKEEAEMLQVSLAAAVVEVGAQCTWGVYVKPFRIPQTRHRYYAVCVGRLFS